MASKKVFTGSLLHAIAALMAILLLISVVYIVGTRDVRVTVTSDAGFVPGAVVELNLNGNFYTTSTNADGEAFFFAIPRGREGYISVKQPGYYDYYAPIKVDAADKQVVVMQEMPPTPPEGIVAEITAASDAEEQPPAAPEA